VPEAFDAVLRRALAKEPDDRYPSAGDLGRAAVAAAAGHRTVSARGSVATGAATPEHAEPTRAAAVAGATAVMAPAGATALADPPAPTEDRARPPARHAPPRPATVRVQRGRRRKVALAATFAVLALPTVAVVQWIARGDATPSGPLSAGEVRTAAQSFADAYTHEDAAALRRILTPGARRVSPGDVQRGRPAVVGEYQRQFAADQVERYALDALQISGGTVGRAAAHYRVTRKGAAAITGKLVLLIVRRGGRPVIDLIGTEPRTT
jgi:serine/threonine-protein kinase